MTAHPRVKKRHFDPGTKIQLLGGQTRIYSLCTTTALYVDGACDLCGRKVARCLSCMLVARVPHP